MRLFAAGKSHHSQRRRQFAIRGNVIKSRHQFTAGEVATGTKNDYTAGRRTGAGGLIFTKWIRRFQKNEGEWG